MRKIWKNITFAVLVIMVVGLLWYLRTSTPFLAVASGSMEPTLSLGDIIIINEISPYEVEEGDIIIFNVPAPIQETYNYPPVISHRVIRVTTSGEGITFRTKGDNTGEDPFNVLPGNIKGKYMDSIPYIGYPVLFVNSKQGIMFIIAAAIIFSIYGLSGTLNQARQRLPRQLLAPVIEENQHASQMITQRMEASDQVLAKFTSAIEVYAQHLQSHTSAIQGLSEASQELKKSAAEQNKVLSQLTGVIQQVMLRTEQPVQKMEEAIPRSEEIIPVTKALIIRPKQLRSGIEQD